MAPSTECSLCGRSIEPRASRAGRHAYCKDCTARADREITLTPRVECRECGKAFPTKTRSVHYCSDGCRSAAARRRNSEYQRRYASDPKKRAMKLARARASAAARRARDRGGGGGKNPPPRAGRDVGGLRRNATAAEPYACALCGRDFEPYGGSRPVHCKRCRAEIDREIGREMTVSCKECGREFATSNRAARYCSRECGDAGWNRSNRESVRRRMDDPEKHVLAAARMRAWSSAHGGGGGGRGGRGDA